MSLYTLIGVMSGTSMDGIDIIYGDYEITDNERLPHTIRHSKTYEYPDALLELLEESTKFSATRLLELDKMLGNYFAHCIDLFIKFYNINKDKIDAIASHGHTIFHQPDIGYTYQIGCGDTIAAKTGIKVINDFRQKDIIAGGQGAPLVPIGDKYLFGHLAEAFLNIGGFCNISMPGNNTTAFDICPGNLPLNEIAKSLGHPFDDKGKIAASGMINTSILHQLNALPFYSAPPPKSLGTEWIKANFESLIHAIPEPTDRMRTLVEHISDQIANVCLKHDISSLYITGGGAYNDFLTECIRKKCAVEIIVPDSSIIEFKEGIIFGLLGALYLNGRPNTLSSVTGATHDVIGGVLHLP